MSLPLLKISLELITSANKRVRITSGQWMINIICTIVMITLWELIDQTNPAQLLDFSVSRANGFGIYLFVHIESRSRGCCKVSFSFLIVRRGSPWFEVGGFIWSSGLSAVRAIPRVSVRWSGWVKSPWATLEKGIKWEESLPAGPHLSRTLD